MLSRSGIFIYPVMTITCLYITASVFILSSVKASDQVQEIVTKELQHTDPNQRINAILRYVMKKSYFIDNGMTAVRLQIHYTYSEHLKQNILYVGNFSNCACLRNSHFHDESTLTGDKCVYEATGPLYLFE